MPNLCCTLTTMLLEHSKMVSWVIKKNINKDVVTNITDVHIFHVNYLSNFSKIHRKKMHTHKCKYPYTGFPEVRITTPHQ